MVTFPISCYKVGNESTIAEIDALTTSELWIITPVEYIDSITINNKVAEKAAALATKRRIFI